MWFYKINALYFRYKKKNNLSSKRSFSSISVNNHAWRAFFKSFLKPCMVAYNCYPNNLVAGSGESKYTDILDYTMRPCYKQTNKQTNKTKQSVSCSHVCGCVWLCTRMLVCRTEDNRAYCSLSRLYLVTVLTRFNKERIRLE